MNVFTFTYYFFFYFYFSQKVEREFVQFMLENDQKVILVTSTVSGEGKSFISSNLAISLSLLGKKVVIVGLDIRKPGLNKIFNLPRKEHSQIEIFVFCHHKR